MDTRKEHGEMILSTLHPFSQRYLKNLSVLQKLTIVQCWDNLMRPYIHYLQCGVRVFILWLTTKCVFLYCFANRLFYVYWLIFRLCPLLISLHFCLLHYRLWNGWCLMIDALRLCSRSEGPINYFAIIWIYLCSLIYKNYFIFRRKKSTWNLCV